MNQNPSHSYFQGWYFKNQKEDDILSFIPAYHMDEEGKKSASLQVNTPKEAYQIHFPYQDLRFSRRRLAVSIGENVFTSQGIRINIHTKDLTATGKLTYGAFTPMKKDIMGPFRHIPWMPCYHNVYSMAHNISGELTVNGNRIDFNHGMGYTEGDQGTGFPTDYLWTQCSWQEEDHNSLMLSVADLQLGPINFTGCIGVIYYKWREYRFATYLGVRIKKVNPNEIWVQQGNYELQVKILEKLENTLLAPVKGSMIRKVYESVDARMKYRFSVDGKVMFEFIRKGCFERGL